MDKMNPARYSIIWWMWKYQELFIPKLNWLSDWSEKYTAIFHHCENYLTQKSQIQWFLLINGLFEYAVNEHSKSLTLGLWQFSFRLSVECYGVLWKGR